MVDLSDVTWPKTIISFPVHTAVWYDGAGPVRLRPPTEKWGAALVLMATQQLASGSNRAPVQRAVWPKRGSGAPLVGSAAQVFEVGKTRAPVSRVRGLRPPQMIISLPVQIAVCESLAEEVSGETGMADHRCCAGLYRAPVER